MSARIGVITFPGTLDDVDAARAVRAAGAESVSLWHADADLKGVDAVVVPGHGATVDLEYARAQCADIATVASVIRQRLDTGVALADAQREPDARLPYPLEVLAEAFARGWHSG